MLSGVILSFFIEIFQLFLYKGTDIDHMILASVGTLLGYLVYKFLSYKFEIKMIKILSIAKVVMKKLHLPALLK
ncbi:VanZ family protein [Terrisporobacter mayombei]|uniref:VanZ family protein n=1 Tax=Terrisporobacter mayombei TaxID=1541 RepID=UPI003F696BB7